MKNRALWIGVNALAIGMFFSSGCTPLVPVSYPAIELPLTKGMNTSTVVDDIIEVPASRLWHKTIEIPETLGEVEVVGWCVASGGARNDVKVLVLDDVDFYNWKNFAKVKGLYQSEKTSVANVTALIENPGKYHLIISNWFSEFSSKIVIAKVYLYWSVKPVAFKINSNDIALEDADEFQIPKNAEVTFKFIDKVNTSNFKVTKDGREIPISANISGEEVKFIAPSIGIYEFSCGSGSLVIKGKFSVVLAQPIIGQGLTISSNMANTPPRLDRMEDKIYESKDYLSPFSLNAIDPDDDVLTYYAFNLPEAPGGNDNGRQIWLPAATLDKNSGKLTWNPVSGNLSAGKYYVRFEVSDGILSDYQDIIIEIKR
jgi:hypothetical protein